MCHARAQDSADSDPQPVTPPACPLHAPVVTRGPQHFGRNRQEVVWFLCVISLGAVFALTLLSLLVHRLRAEWVAEQPDLAADALWILACAGILVVLALAVREFVRYLRKRVSVLDEGLRVGAQLLRWADIVEVREAREFRSGAWFYHLELRTAAGAEAWITSGLVADYAGLRAAMLERRPDLPLTLVSD